MGKKYLPTEDTHLAIKNALTDISDKLEIMGRGKTNKLTDEEMKDILFVLKYGSGE